MLNFRKMKEAGFRDGYQAISWVALFSMAINFVLLLALMSLTAFLLTVWPLQKIEPMLVTFHEKSKELVTIEPINKGTHGIYVLMEGIARQYVLMRETIDLQSESIRWNALQKFMSSDLFATYAKAMSPENKDSPYLSFKKRGVTREVSVTNCMHLAPESPNTWLVEWQFKDIEQATGEVLASGQRLSKVVAELSKQTIANVGEEKYINPIGFTVVEYSVNFKGTSS
jgi:type IV secretory pathway component VirB8